MALAQYWREGLLGLSVILGVWVVLSDQDAAEKLGRLATLGGFDLLIYRPQISGVVGYSQIDFLIVVVASTLILTGIVLS